MKVSRAWLLAAAVAGFVAGIATDSTFLSWRWWLADGGMLAACEFGGWLERKRLAS